MLVRDGAVVRDITTYDSTTLHVYSGGTLTGSMYLDSAIVEQGGVVDFDLVQVSPTSSATSILHTLSVITGAPTFTLLAEDLHL